MAQTPETGHAASGRWTKFDVVWMLNLFGTAVGAGILFLPINAGMSGIWPLVVITLLVGPMTYFAPPQPFQLFFAFCQPNCLRTRKQIHQIPRHADSGVSPIFIFQIGIRVVINSRAEFNSRKQSQHFLFRFQSGDPGFIVINPQFRTINQSEMFQIDLPQIADNFRIIHIRRNIQNKFGVRRQIHQSAQFSFCR